MNTLENQQQVPVEIPTIPNWNAEAATLLSTLVTQERWSLKNVLQALAASPDTAAYMQSSASQLQALLHTQTPQQLLEHAVPISLQYMQAGYAKKESLLEACKVATGSLQRAFGAALLPYLFSLSDSESNFRFFDVCSRLYGVSTDVRTRQQERAFDTICATIAQCAENLKKSEIDQLLIARQHRRQFIRRALPFQNSRIDSRLFPTLQDDLFAEFEKSIKLPSDQQRLFDALQMLSAETAEHETLGTLAKLSKSPARFHAFASLLFVFQEITGVVSVSKEASATVSLVDFFRFLESDKSAFLSATHLRAVTTAEQAHDLLEKLKSSASAYHALAVRFVDGLYVSRQNSRAGDNTIRSAYNFELQKVFSHSVNASFRYAVFLELQTRALQPDFSTVDVDSFQKLDIQAERSRHNLVFGFLPDATTAEDPDLAFLKALKISTALVESGRLLEICRAPACLQQLIRTQTPFALSADVTAQIDYLQTPADFLAACRSLNTTQIEHGVREFGYNFQDGLLDFSFQLFSSGAKKSLQWFFQPSSVIGCCPADGFRSETLVETRDEPLFRRLRELFFQSMTLKNLKQVVQAHPEPLSAVFLKLLEEDVGFGFFRENPTSPEHRQYLLCDSPSAFRVPFLQGLRKLLLNSGRFTAANCRDLNLYVLQCSGVTHPIFTDNSRVHVGALDTAGIRTVKTILSSLTDKMIVVVSMVSQACQAEKFAVEDVHAFLRQNDVMLSKIQDLDVTLAVDFVVSELRKQAAAPTRRPIDTRKL